jgi:hypothetical protein
MRMGENKGNQGQLHFQDLPSKSVAGNQIAISLTTGRTGCLCRENLRLPPDLTLLPSQYRESEKRVENYGLKAITRSSMRAILRVASDALFEPLFPDQHRARGCGLFLS